MKDIRDSGGIHLTLDFGTGLKHDAITIPIINLS